MEEGEKDEVTTLAMEDKEGETLASMGEGKKEEKEGKEEGKEGPVLVHVSERRKENTEISKCIL